ncbi:MAG: S8 family peptidase [Bdellovibrionales bacterium]
MSLVLLLGSSSFLFSKKLENRIPNEEKKQKRSLILGQPNFISSKNSNVLKRHVENQWALKDISILEAWKKTRGQKNIVVAVVDTGIHLLHPCLKPNLWTNPKEIPNNQIDDDGNGLVDDIHGWNFVDNNNDLQDRHGHGTHIAGLIAATGSTDSNPDCKVIGVAPEVSLMVLKYYDSNNDKNNILNTIKSINYAIQQGAHIINYSGGGPGANEQEKTLIAKAADKNIIFISASGNNSTEIGKDTKYYPASYELPNIIYVQSKNAENEIIDSSNWVTKDYRKRKIYQTAPGERVISTLPPKRYLRGQILKKIWRSLAQIEPLKHDNYGFMTGTSQATAVATGVAALVKSLYPSWSMTQVIKQIYKTGFGQGTEKIQAKTQEGKKLNAYESLIMRDQNIDFSDLPNNSNIIMPATDKTSTLQNLQNSRGRIDIYDPAVEEDNSINALQDVRKNLTPTK